MVLRAAPSDHCPVSGFPRFPCASSQKLSLVLFSAAHPEQSVFWGNVAQQVAFGSWFSLFDLGSGSWLCAHNVRGCG